MKYTFRDEVYGIGDNVGLNVEFGQVLGVNSISLTDESSPYYEEWVATTIYLDDIEDRKEWVTALREEIKNEEKDSINFPESFINKLEDLATEIEKTIN